MYSMIVTIKIKEGFRDKFIAAMFDDAIGSIRDEVGCYRSDILQDADEDNTIHLYEVYEDQEAVEVHRNAPHYLKWRSIVNDWFDGEPQRIVSSSIFPPMGLWKQQKPELINYFK